MKKLILNLLITLHSFAFISICAQEENNHYDEVIAHNIAEEYEKENKNDIEDHINYLKDREKYETAFGLEEMRNFSGAYTGFFKGWMNNCQNIHANNAQWGVVYGCKKIVNLMRNVKNLPEKIDERRHHIIENIDHTIDTIENRIKEKPFAQNQDYENGIAKDLAGYNLWDRLFGPNIYTKSDIRFHKNNIKHCSLSHSDPLNKNFSYCVHLADRIEEKYPQSSINTQKKQYAQSFVQHVRNQEQKRVVQAQQMFGEQILPHDSKLRASLAKKMEPRSGWDFRRKDFERSMENCELNAPVYSGIGITPCYMIARQLEEIASSLTGEEKEYAQLFIKHKKDGPCFDREVQNKFPSHEFGSSKKWFNMPN